MRTHSYRRRRHRSLNRGPDRRSPPQCRLQSGDGCQEIELRSTAMHDKVEGGGNKLAIWGEGVPRSRQILSESNERPPETTSRPQPQFGNRHRYSASQVQRQAEMPIARRRLVECEYVPVAGVLQAAPGRIIISSPVQKP